jgi:hypothetical protein
MPLARTGPKTPMLSNWRTTSSDGKFERVASMAFSKVFDGATLRVCN